MKMSAYWNVQVRWSFKIQRAFGVCLLDFIIFSCFHHFYFYSCALVLQAEHPIRVISLSNCPKLIQLAQPAKKPPTVWNAAYRCSMMDRLDGRPLDWCITVLKLAKIKIKNNNLSRKIKNIWWSAVLIWTSHGIWLHASHPDSVLSSYFTVLFLVYTITKNGIKKRKMNSNVLQFILKHVVLIWTLQVWVWLFLQSEFYLFNFLFPVLSLLSLKAERKKQCVI